MLFRSPASFTFVAEGTKTLFAYVKDEAGNVSSGMSGQVVITLPDVTTPSVTAFTIPATSTSLVVPVSSFTASDNKAVTGYILTESSNAPLAGDAGWNATAPASFTFAAEGTKTLYAYVKDEAGNVSSGMSGQVVITLPDVTNPSVTAFAIPATSNSLVVNVSSFTAFDNKAVSGYILTESSNAPLAGDAGWNATAPASFTFPAEGTKTLYAYVKDEAGNVSSGMSSQVVITLPDVIKPSVTAFTIPGTSNSLVVAVDNFSASDNKCVSGFILTESSNAPLAGDAGWNVTAPASFTFAAEGSKTLYAYVKDEAGNVSSSVSDQVVITLPDEIKINEVPVQTIALRKGWNILSSYLIPQNSSMDAVMENLRTSGKLLQVEDELGNTFVKQSNTGIWLNNIGNLNKTEGYKISVSSDCNLVITGNQITLPLIIDIKKGTNLISFPFNGSIDAMQFIQPLIDSGVLYKVQDERGNSIEYWKNLGWINGIGNFNAGEGYILQANINGTLVINDLTAQKAGVYFVQRLETLHYKVCYDGNGFGHMNININELNKTNLQVGDEIAVYDGQICVGAIKLTDMDFENRVVGIPVSASDLIGLKGFTDGNSIEMKVWKSEKNEEYKLNTEVDDGELVFKRYSSTFITINDNQIVSGISDFDLLNISVYPNPASSVVNVNFSNLPEIGTEITIMDVSGREIIRRTVENINESMKIQDLPGGMYLVKIQLNNNFKIQKLIKN